MSGSAASSAGWEYKGKHKDLDTAFDQLLRYRNALENPPLLVLCDLDRIVVRTNFTGTVSDVHEIPLEALAEPRNIEIMRAVFHNPKALIPGRTSVAVTQEAAARIGEIAAAMRERGLDPGTVAHFLDRIVFCLFAEDSALLPDMIFTRMLEKTGADPARFGRSLTSLFEAMATGGDFGLEAIRHFNGSLFDDHTVPGLTPDDIKRLAAVSSLDWSAVDPSIFGTLFERGLDPAKRSQLGAHFTGREDIERVVDTVVMTPLRRDWEEIKATIECLLATGKKRGAGERGTGVPPVVQHGQDAHATNAAGATGVSPVVHHGQDAHATNAAGATGVSPVVHHGQDAHATNIVRATSNRKPLSAAALKKARIEADSILHQFLIRLREVKILDPACGSGNFLYVALLRLKDLELEAAVIFPSAHGLNTYLPGVGPWQLYGIEINPYAHGLAQMTVWIGWLQWIRVNGFGFPADPILRPLSDNIRLMSAIIDCGADERGTGERGTGVSPVGHHGQDAHATNTAGGTGVSPVSQHGQDAHATNTAGGTGVPPVVQHGQDAHATNTAGGTGVSPVSQHGQDAHATNIARATMLNPFARVDIRHGAYLPHWTQENATYVVVFRLCDSLPSEVLRQWIMEREDIVKTASQAGRDLSESERQRLAVLYAEKVEKWLDSGYGACWLKDERIASIVRDALAHFDGPRYTLLAWCVMPNHVHAVLRPAAGHNVADILHSWKSFTAKKANEILNRSGEF
ncbi:MAG: DNA methyltransferase [Kiritimatiellia bacterium]